MRGCGLTNVKKTYDMIKRAVRGRDGEVTCMAAIAFSISIACSLFNVTTGDRPGPSGGVLVAGNVGRWHCTISVRGIVNVGMIDASMY